MKLFPKFRPPDVAVEGTVAGQGVEIARTIRSQSSARLPDAAEPPIRRRVVHHHLLEAGRVVPENPAVIRTLIAVRGPCDVDGAVIDQQTDRWFSVLALNAMLFCASRPSPVPETLA